MSSWSFGQRVIKNQTRTVNQTGTQRSDAFTDGVVYVRCTADTTGVFIAFGKTPTAAVSTGIRLVANEPKTFKVVVVVGKVILSLSLIIIYIIGEVNVLLVKF